MNRVRLEWDEDKRRANLLTHGVDFRDAGVVFDSRTVSFEDDRGSYGERRFVTFGMLHDRLIAIVHTERDEKIRSISMRKASKHEERSYFSRIRD